MRQWKNTGIISIVCICKSKYQKVKSKANIHGNCRRKNEQDTRKSNECDIFLKKKTTIKKPNSVV